MKRQHIYKQIALSLLLLVCAAGNNLAWGQNENYPGNVKYGTNVNIEAEAKNRLPILSLEASLEPSNPSDSRNQVKHIWDGVVDGNSWCEFAEDDEVVLQTFMNSDYVVIEKILIYRGATEDESPVSITIQYGDEEKKEPDGTITFSNLQQNNSGNDGKPLLLTLAKPIKNARALAIILTPEEGANIALDEIMLLGKYMTVKHRTTKWKQLHDNGNYSDSFDDVEMFDNTNSSVFEDLSMQPAHHYTDTIYMKKGDTRTLILPDRNTDATTYGDMNNKSYRRWYDYKTDGFTDALKPKEEDADVLMQIANGYLHLPYQHLNKTDKDPKGQNTPTPYQIDFTYPTNGEDSYIIACDVSNYIDVNLDLSTIQANDEGEYTFSEPTLSHRVLYYIKAIPEGTMDANYYHEKYDISFPFTRISNHTLDIVALSKDADAYAFPNDADDSDTEGLSVEITGENSAGIKLQAQKETDTWFSVTDNGTKATLSGNHRTISFAYPHTRESDGTQFVGESTDNGTTDNYTATITVKKGNYNIATYNLTFKRNTVLLTQSIISKIEKTEETEGRDDKWDAYKFRTPQTLSDNYGMPITELNWDYTPESVGSYYSTHYYRFPMDWSYSTYGFFDGSQSNQIIASIREHPYPEWGHYAITDGYIESLNNSQEWAWPSDHTSPAPQNKLTNSSGAESTYHLYVDASDRPGTIARLTFDGDLCTGSEIIVSAWVKSAAAWNKDGSNDDASVLFTIMGVKDEEIDETTREVRVPLYRHCTGQIRNTLYMDTSIPGCGGENNEWLQVYFSFINDAQPNEYKEYLLQVDNYSASSNGADIYFDDIRCYVAKPRPRVTQQKLTCGERTRVRMDLNWEQLISRLGLEELTDGSDINNGIDFCFIDVEEYRNALTDNNIAQALEAAAVEIGNGTDYNKKYGSLYYNLNYEENTEYTSYDISRDGNGDYGSLAYKNEKNENNKYFFYRATAGENDAPYANGERLLSVDFYANMSLAREYMILIRDRNSTSGAADDFSSFGNPENPCAITANFQVQGQNLIKMNGEIVKPGETNDYCTGQIFDFSVDMQYLVDGKYVSYTNDDIYFDWFFGTEEEFNGTGENANTNEESLRDALYALRKTDVEAISVWDETEEKWKLQQSADKPVLDAKYVTVIEEYLNEKPADDRLQAKLVLRSKTLEIRILEHGLDLVVAPIDTGDQSSTGANITLCFEPMYLHLTAANKAPQIQPGFEYMQYESDIYNPAMRIGLQQIKDSKSKGIEVNLRNANFAFDTEEYEGDAPTHIGLLYDDENNSTSQKGDNYIYLTDSNDPMLEGILHPTDGTEFDRSGYIIGTVEELKATPHSNSSGSLPDNKMKIKFNYDESMVIGDDDGSKFEPREGYEYTFTILIEEHTDTHSNPQGACRGTLNLTMKVVPEYLVWQGNDNTQNWNNDALWKRATATQLKKDDDTYDYNDGEQGYPGYVPMLFSKVIMPENGKVELYEAGFTGSSTTYQGMSWTTTIDDLEQDMENPSLDPEDGHPIQYDMMVYTEYNNDGTIKSMSTKPYRVNLCEQIHFEPKAEMLHAELLTYEKAWVDYKLESNQWHTLASPLQDVVAGDFYTDSKAGSDANNVAGTENQEYFTDIYFEKSKYTPTQPNGYDIANSRISPSVYQRGWKGETNMVSTGKPNDVAVAGNWSAVYNDVAEPYNPGTGFSLKVLNMPKDVDDAIFRLPKADEKYSYYDANGSVTETESKEIERTNSGKLEISKLDEANTEISVQLQANDNSNYYLIGNPFMAHLDAAKFFDANKSVLEQKYWTVTKDVQNVAASNDGEWASTTETDIPTIAPLQSFFVQKVSGTNVSDEVTFTADMQTLATETDGTNTSALILTAQTADGKVSRAAIAYDATAKTTYETSEDAELFLDSNLSDVPTIYTVAGTMATSINRTSELYNIPVGIYGNSTETVTLSVEGLKNFSSAALYDAEKRTETPLREGTTITLPANTSGRYFLRAGAPTANEQIATDAIQIYTLSGNRVMVTSTTPLKDIRVYTISGALVKQAKAGFCSHELYLPEDGIYVISAKSANGATQTAKVAVN